MSFDKTQKLQEFDAKELEQRHFQSLVAADKPFVVKNLAQNWKALNTWHPERLRTEFGDHMLPVSYWKTSKSQASDKRLSLRNYVDLITDEGTKLNYYADQLPVEDVVPRQLRAELGEVDLLEGYSAVPRIFMSGKWDRHPGNRTHFHAGRHALAICVFGRKMFSLLSPKDRSIKAAPAFSNEFNFADHTVKGWIRGRTEYIDRCHETGFNIQLSSGDGLFIPVDWWHLVSSLEFSILITYFFSAPMAHWHFPFPGFRVLAAQTVPKSVRANIVETLRALKLERRSEGAPTSDS